MSHRIGVLVVAVTAAFSGAPAQVVRSGNPILPGWYADPEAHVFDGQYWIFPTYSAPYDQQTFMDAFSSRDLVTWVKHPRVLDVANVTWARRALWAPSIIEKGRIAVPARMRWCNPLCQPALIKSSAFGSSSRLSSSIKALSTGLLDLVL